MLRENKVCISGCAELAGMDKEEEIKYLSPVPTGAPSAPLTIRRHRDALTRRNSDQELPLHFQLHWPINKVGRVNYQHH